MILQYTQVGYTCCKVIYLHHYSRLPSSRWGILVVKSFTFIIYFHLTPFPPKKIISPPKSAIEIGLFSYCLGLFSYCIGLFSYYARLSSYCIGPFSHYIASFRIVSRPISAISPKDLYTYLQMCVACVHVYECMLHVLVCVDACRACIPVLNSHTHLHFIYIYIHIHIHIHINIYIYVAYIYIHVQIYIYRYRYIALSCVGVCKGVSYI